VNEPTPASPFAEPMALEVSGLTVTLERPHRPPTRLVDDVSFSIPRGQTFGLVGESGSGKTMTALAIIGLLRRTRSIHAGGSVRLDGAELLTLSRRQMATLAGSEIGMVFQDPMSSLNPAYSVGEQIAETLRRHRGLSRTKAWAEATELLRLVELPGAARRVNSYPHEMSGGMRQRVMMAIAVACRPKVLIADEPTTALDVTVQAQILALIRRLQQEMGMAVLFITHNLSVLADLADRVGVMYAGHLVEEAPVLDIFERTKHPYSSTLLRSSPEFLGLPTVLRSARSGPAATSGCRFRLRCEYATEMCEEEPILRLVSGRTDRLSRCVRVDEIEIPNAVDLWQDKERVEAQLLSARVKA
jgi:oligopeptide/dipeptide ABC transporter ATP-binding protein